MGDEYEGDERRHDTRRSSDIPSAQYRFICAHRFNEMAEGLKRHRRALEQNTAKTDAVYAVVNNGLRDGVTELRDNMKWLLRTMLLLLASLLLGGTVLGWRTVRLEEQVRYLDRELRTHTREAEHDDKDSAN